MWWQWALGVPLIVLVWVAVGLLIREMIDLQKGGK